MKNIFVKFTNIFVLFFITITLFNYSFADDYNTLEASSINSRSCIVYDRNSHMILYGKNKTKQVKMASTTKIMTSLIIIENCDLSETLEVSQKAAGTGGSRLGLKAGDKITIKDLLYGLMLCSGNDDAVT